MARSLEQLQQQYNSIAKKNAFKQRPQGGPRGRGMMGGKPKSAKKTIARLLTYMRGFRLRFALVLVCMLLTTVTSLVGSYFMAPIINKLTAAVNPNFARTGSFFEGVTDNWVTRLTETFFPGDAKVMTYVLVALIMLGLIYCVGVITTYTQTRLMLSISQGMIERIRNDLFA